jgi:hypothetical protein
MGTAPEADDEEDATDDGDEADASAVGASTAGTDGGNGSGHRFGQTRVYTPPEGDDSVESERCAICGETYAADAGHTNCPNCNAVIEKE